MLHVLVDREAGQYLGHPTTAMLDDGKTILTVYPKGHGRGAIVYKRSTDGGKTWSAPRRLPDGILGPIKNKPVVLADGTWLSPSSSEGSKDGWLVHFERSQDAGLTWEKIGPVRQGPAFDAIQPSILFHKDGQLQALCRSKQGVVTQTWSGDGGQNWSALTAAALPNPNSGIDALTGGTENRTTQAHARSKAIHVSAVRWTRRGTDRVGLAVIAVEAVHHVEVHERAFWMACHTVIGVAGQAMSRTPRASVRALMKAGGEPMAPASPQPFTPSGLWVQAVTQE